MFFGVKITIILIVLSTLNMLYMQTTQDSVYGVQYNPRFKIIVFAYFGWVLMATAIKILIVDQKDFGYVSVLTTAPLLGVLIYTCSNINIMSFDPTWTLNLALLDIIYGGFSFMFVTMVIYLIEKFST